MILPKISCEALIVQSTPSSSPSCTLTLPSVTLTVHWPAPSMSKAYELFMPAVFDVSARDESVSKNSCTLSGISVAPCRGRARVYAPPPASQRYHRAPMTKVEIGLPGQAGADAVALPVAQPLGGDGAKIVDDKLGGRLRKLGESGDLRGECGEAVLLHLNGELDAPRLVAAGGGKRGPGGGGGPGNPGGGGPPSPPPLRG